MLSRRDLIGAASLALVAPWSSSALAQTPRRRRNVAGMGPADPDLVALRTGIAAMRSRSDRLSYEYQRQIHAIYVRQHGTWLFLPWHRAQLHAFEQIIATLSGKSDFALPYWDWQQTPNIPPIFFTDPTLRIAGRSATGSTDFKARRWGWNPQFARVLLDDLPTFAGERTLAGSVESYGHNAIHVIIGGAMGAVHTATLDPLFWLHHANIDRVWSTWHDHRPRTYPAEFQAERISGLVGPAGSLPQVYSGQLLDTLSLGYRYDEPYPFPTFNVTLAAPPGTTRREFVRQTDYFTAAQLSGQPSATIELPAAALAALRSDRDQALELEGTGTVRLSTNGLQGRVLRVVATAPDGGGDGQSAPVGVTVLASPAFFHEPAADATHAGIAHADNWGVVYRVGAELAELIGTSRGRVLLTADTIPVESPSVNVGPPVQEFGIGLRVKTYRWR